MQIDVILKRFEQPDETRTMELGKYEVVHLGGLTVGRATYQRGGNGRAGIPNLSANPHRVHRRRPRRRHPAGQRKHNRRPQQAPSGQC